MTLYLFYVYLNGSFGYPISPYEKKKSCSNILTALRNVSLSMLDARFSSYFYVSVCSCLLPILSNKK